jgi:hypothetical protein
MNVQRLIAVLRLTGGAPGTLVRGDTVAQKLAGSTLVPNLNPTLVVFKADLDALRASQAVKGNGTQAVSARNDALKTVRRDLENLRICTQQAADANPELAATIIVSAGMYVKIVPVRNKADLAVVQGASSGSAIARAKSRGRGATYWWEVSSDQKTWSSAPVTRIATASFAGLTPGTTYYFRFQVLTAAGLSDWSQNISFLVK